MSLDQSRSIVHADPTNPNDSIYFLADNLITLSVTATDGDGDTATVAAPINIAQNFMFLDDGPAITSASNINIQNSGDVAHTGAFVYNLGADGAPLNNDVFKTQSRAAPRSMASR